MRLIDVVNAAPHPLVVPLVGFPGVSLTDSTIYQNEFNAELQARTIRALVERFQPDLAFFFMDLAVEAGAIGLPVDFPLHESPTVTAHPVQGPGDLEQYRVVDPLHHARVGTYVETMRRMKGMDVLRGAYVTGPFTLAGLMMGASEVALATLDRPAFLHAVLEFASDVILRYGRALVEAGAELVCILEPTVTFISPEAFREFSGRYVREFAEEVDAMHLLHVCGDTTHLIEAMCETGVDGLSLDAPVDLPAIAERVPDDVVLVGNVDPVRVMVNEDPEGVRSAVRSLRRGMQGHANFVLSTGCDLPPETPLENVDAFMEAGRESL